MLTGVRIFFLGGGKGRKIERVFVKIWGLIAVGED